MTDAKVDPARLVGKVVETCIVEGAWHEVTLTVEYPNGSRHYIVVPINRMTELIEPPNPNVDWKENPPHGPVSERIMRHYYGAK